MNGPRHSEAHAKLRSISRFALWSTVAFVLLSLLFTVLYRDNWTGDLQLQCRAGVLRDLIDEMPIGRQGLVSSMWVMPLPTLGALPFTVLLPAERFGLAYLYGLALATALAAMPLAALLRRCGMPLSRPFAVAILLGAASATVRWHLGDLLPCLSCLVIAAYFDAHGRPALRAMAGVFYGLAMFAHLVGLIVFLARVAGMVVSRLARGSDEQRAAVRWTQCAGMAYVLAVYLFLNWMIMRDPFWPTTHFVAQRPGACSREAGLELRSVLASRYPSSAPVASGLWGYAAGGFLVAADGHHFIDFHPDKMPSWERREVILVVPKRSNPLAPLCDLGPVVHGNPTAVSRYLLLSDSPNWEYYLAVRAEPPGERTAAAGAAEGSAAVGVEQ